MEQWCYLRAEIFVFSVVVGGAIAQLSLGKKSNRAVRAAVCEAFTRVCDQNDVNVKVITAQKTLYIRVNYKEILEYN